MGTTKSEKHSEAQNLLAEYFKVLGHPARIAILQNLFERESCVCGDLVSKIGLAQPTISQHLKELKRVGFIKGNVEGNSVCYCIDRENWIGLRDLLKDFLDQDIKLKTLCC